jgi:NAD(P)-dependent dehydrogenase (short-subunit alcohol dehydrogenase family)
MKKSLNRLDGKVAIITGSTKGLGKATATKFAYEGCKVVVSGRDEGAGKAVIDEITSNGGEAIFIRADVGIEEDVKNLIQSAAEKWGKLDILINNAAPSDFIAAGGEESVEDQSTENWEYMFRVCITGPFWACKYAIPYMKKAGAGSIVNISSSSSKVGLKKLVSYSSTKGAMNAFTRQVAVEYGEFGIRSNCIVVGFIPSGGNASQKVLDDPITRAAVEKMSVTRMGRPEDVAYACLVLSTDEAEFITGIEFTVDGGMLAQPPVAEVRGPDGDDR